MVPFNMGERTCQHIVKWEQFLNSKVHFVLFYRTQIENALMPFQSGCPSFSSWTRQNTTNNKGSYPSLGGF